MYVTLQRIFNARLKNCHLLFSAVISQHFSKTRMIISVVAANIWYLKKCTVFIGPPCILIVCSGCSIELILLLVLYLLNIARCMFWLQYRADVGTCVLR